MPVNFDGHLGVVKGIFVLTPYDPDEVLTLDRAANRARKTQNTIRNWCESEGIGRKIGGRWCVSKVALEMHLDGRTNALSRYLRGDRTSGEVVAYFSKFGLTPQNPVVA
jgi:hypothetical protein